MPSAPLDGTPVKFALRLQDIPGVTGVVPEGQTWKIVMLERTTVGYGADGMVSPQVFGKENWEQVICEGTISSDGLIRLSKSRQQELFRNISVNPGRVWLVSGLSAMELRVANWSTGKASLNTRRISDALNFTREGRLMDTARDALMSEVVRVDAQLQSVAPLNQKISI